MTTLEEILVLPLAKQAIHANNPEETPLNDNFSSWNVETIGNVAHLILYSKNISSRMQAQRLKREFMEWYGANRTSSRCALL
jgi:hypothetical protein